VARLKAVIFDMDDTLIDWSQRTQDWYEYERQHLGQVFDYIAREVHPVRAPEDFYEAARVLAREAWLEAERGLRAPNLGTVMSKALEQIGVPVNLIDAEACLRAYDWQPVGGVAVYPDVAEVLPILVARQVKIGLITNAYQPMWMRDRELEAFGLLAHFANCRLSAADVGYLKPHPTIFQTALGCLGVQSEEAVFIGDNPEADVAGAQSVGMKAVLRIGKRVPPLISGLIIPDGAINSLHELLPLLDAWYPGWRALTPTAATTVPSAKSERTSDGIQTVDAKNETKTAEIGTDDATRNNALS
jgi:putative hydrolase of the HAD superfamily